MDPLLLTIIFVLFLCILGLSWFAGSDAPFVATRMEQIKQVLEAAGLKKGKLFYELGSGDGRVVYQAAKLQADAIGIEQSYLRVWYSRYQAKKQRLKTAVFYHGDIFKRQYFPADVIYIFLLQKAIDRLEVKLQKELKPGATVITQRYHFKNWQPFKQIGEFNLYRK